MEECADWQWLRARDERLLDMSRWSEVQSVKGTGTSVKQKRCRIWMTGMHEMDVPHLFRLECFFDN